MPIFDPNAKFKVYKGDKLIYTNAPSGSFGDVLAWFMKNDDGMPESEMDKVKGLNLEAVVASKAAMEAMVNSELTMYVVATSKAVMNAVAASKTAMNAVAASKTAMFAVLASKTAMDAVAASDTAIVSLANSSYSRTTSSDITEGKFLVLGKLNGMYPLIVDESTPDKKKELNAAAIRQRKLMTKYGNMNVTFDRVKTIFSKIDDYEIEKHDLIILYDLS